MSKLHDHRLGDQFLDERNGKNSEVSTTQGERRWPTTCEIAVEAVLPSTTIGDVRLLIQVRHGS